MIQGRFTESDASTKVVTQNNLDDTIVNKTLPQSHWLYSKSLLPALYTHSAAGLQGSSAWTETQGSWLILSYVPTTKR